MAKKQTRRSISVSRTTYERLKAFCETNNISMSQLVETRVNDFLGTSDVVLPHPTPSAPVRPMTPMTPMAPRVTMASPPPIKPVESKPAQHQASASAPTSTTSGTSAATPAQPVPMTSAAARFVVEPPPPIIKPRQDTAAPKPAEKRPEQIFTF
jgi:hypothetical protein